MSETEYCSFCGKKRDEVSVMVAGSTVRICDECVEICNQIVDAEIAVPPRKVSCEVRILVAIDEKGNWVSGGYSGCDNDPRDWLALEHLTGEQVAYHWVNADVPIPTEGTIRGRVSES